MAQNLYLELSDKRILVAGAGVTGIAAARALVKRGAQVTITDEKVVELAGFPVSYTHLTLPTICSV